MTFPSPGRATRRRRMPRRTVRLRLTVLQGGLFLATGASLIGITYLLALSEFPGRFTTHLPGADRLSTGDSVVAPGGGLNQQTSKAAQRADDMHLFLGESVVALAIMTLLSIGLAWIVAGRLLRPLRVMTASTRQIFGHNLHERLALEGPRDELKELSDTIDGLLARLESAFDAQRLFVAHASHEMRTPLTLERAMLEIILADPNATAGTLRATCEEVLQVNRQQERLIDALLTLARSQRGLATPQMFDLSAITAAATRNARQDAEPRILVRSASFPPAPVSGDPDLAERLVTNLLDNAVRYNVVDGTVDVSVEVAAGQAVLRICNTGPPLPADQISRLFQPFQRIDRSRTGNQDGRDGLGLGLSIVAAVALSHDAAVSARPGAAGGLDISVSFPLAAWEQSDARTPAPRREALARPRR